MPTNKINNTTRALEYIRNEIISGKIKPGERIIENNIATQVGMSRAPVREAINALVQEGLVEHNPRQGASVRQITIDDILDMYEMRVCLDTQALKLALPHLNEQHLNVLEGFNRQMRESAEQLQMIGVRDADFNFYTYVVEISRSPRLKRAYHSLLNELEIATWLLYDPNATPNFQNLEMVMDEHDIILKGLRQRDLAKATAADVHHLKVWYEAASIKAAKVGSGKAELRTED